MKTYLLVSFFICLPVVLSAQQVESNSDIYRLNWFVSVGFGSQMSGIKSEDFITSNYSPLMNVSIGKWFTRELALEFGYKGWYFNLIIDEEKHPYTYIYFNKVLNLNKLIANKYLQSKWSLNVHIGSGYFYNHNYARPNICANFGISNNYRVSSQITAFLKASAIIGWDIYQGNEDILPGLSAGVTYAL